MKTTTMISCCAFACVCGSAMAELPQLHAWPMQHIMLTFDGSTVGAHADPTAMDPVLLQRFSGESYDGAASVLDDSYYSDQYGWLADGFISLGADEFMWIERVSSSAGLNVYEGGMRMMREFHSYDAILGTDGSSDRWMWGGTMTHNWYSADALGDYEATYFVYVGDANGDAYTQYQGAEVTLYFSAVPAPSAMGLLGLAGFGAMRRRR